MFCLRTLVCSMLSSCWLYSSALLLYTRLAYLRFFCDLPVSFKMKYLRQLFWKIRPNKWHLWSILDSNSMWSNEVFDYYFSFSVVFFGFPFFDFDLSYILSRDYFNVQGGSRRSESSERKGIWAQITQARTGSCPSWETKTGVPPETAGEAKSCI